MFVAIPLSYFRKLADDGIFVNSSIYADKPFSTVFTLVKPNHIGDCKVQLLFVISGNGWRTHLFVRTFR